MRLGLASAPETKCRRRPARRAAPLRAVPGARAGDGRSLYPRRLPCGARRTGRGKSSHRSGCARVPQSTAPYRAVAHGTAPRSSAPYGVEQARLR